MKQIENVWYKKTHNIKQRTIVKELFVLKLYQNIIDDGYEVYEELSEVIVLKYDIMHIAHSSYSLFLQATHPNFNCQYGMKVIFVLHLYLAIA